MIVTLSESWKNYFQTITNGPQIRIVENIVAPPQEGCQLWNDGKCHLLFLGKVCKEKGIFDLLDVIRKHKMEFEGKVVLHIGGNGMTNELTGRMQQDELRDIIVYEGFVLGTQKLICYIAVAHSSCPHIPKACLSPSSNPCHMANRY